MSKMTPYRAPDGTLWGAQVRMPSHSSAMVIFHHPTGETARLNRYAWLNVRSATAQDPSAHLDAHTLAGGLNEAELARLFRRSLPMNTERPGWIVS
ncbi:MAG: hypothetical protein IT361_07415 [Gemmatimonadaceae bacterium]|nr:hypothetical protein [Gemmatimonadaceae bacterium]